MLPARLELEKTVRVQNGDSDTSARDDETASDLRLASLSLSVPLAVPVVSQIESIVDSLASHAGA